MPIQRKGKNGKPLKTSGPYRLKIRRKTGGAGALPSDAPGKKEKWHGGVGVG